MSDTPCDFAPGLHSLHLLNLRDVLEKDHDAHGLSLVVAQGCSGYHHGTQLVRQNNLDLALHTLSVFHAFQDVAHDLELSKLKDLPLISSEDTRSLDSEHLLGSFVPGRNSSSGIDRDHARRNIGEKGLHKALSLLQFQIALLHLSGHLIERFH